GERRTAWSIRHRRVLSIFESPQPPLSSLLSPFYLHISTGARIKCIERINLPGLGTAGFYLVESAQL
ncbi:MAG: hypothetical protein QF352_07865, partial [Arenicellales bacterium]|nr:hypothetical protein [Arenicellales bacterium]